MRWAAAGAPRPAGHVQRTYVPPCTARTARIPKQIRPLQACSPLYPPASCHAALCLKSPGAGPNRAAEGNNGLVQAASGADAISVGLRGPPNTTECGGGRSSRDGHLHGIARLSLQPHRNTSRLKPAQIAQRKAATGSYRRPQVLPRSLWVCGGRLAPLGAAGAARCATGTCMALCVSGRSHAGTQVA